MNPIATAVARTLPTTTNQPVMVRYIFLDLSHASLVMMQKVFPADMSSENGERLCRRQTFVFKGFLAPRADILRKRRIKGKRNRKTAGNFYFFLRRFGADFFADLDEGGGGVPSIRRKPSSKLKPCDSIAFGLAGMIRFNFTCRHFATFLCPSKGKSQNRNLFRHLKRLMNYYHIRNTTR